MIVVSAAVNMVLVMIKLSQPNWLTSATVSMPTNAWLQVPSFNSTTFVGASNVVVMFQRPQGAAVMKLETTPVSCGLQLYCTMRFVSAATYTVLEMTRLSQPKTLDKNSVSEPALAWLQVIRFSMVAFEGNKLVAVITMLSQTKPWSTATTMPVS